MTSIERWLRRLGGVTLGLAALLFAGCGECGSCGGGAAQAPESDAAVCCPAGDADLVAKEGDCTNCRAEKGSECCLTAKKECCPEASRAALIAAGDAEQDPKEEPILALAEEKTVDLKVGDAAPSFEATDDQGKTWKSSDHVGKKVIVVYFYPADFTGGCTKQACAFRDDYQTLADKGIEVVGVSGDSAKTHALFKKHHKLTFTLLADEQGTVAGRFGVPTKPGGEFKTKVDAEEHVFKRGVTASRWTFVIGKDGKIAYKNTKVNAAADSKDVLKAVEGLGR